MADKMSQVLCVPKSCVLQHEFLYGYSQVTQQPIIHAAASFVSRDWAEVAEDHHFLQVIPYVVFVDSGKHAAYCRVLSYTRVKGGGESRLLGKKSIGFGGHIEGEDMYPQGTGLCDKYAEAVAATIQYAVTREIAEELGTRMAIATHHARSLIGLIYSTTTAVGSVHLGMLYTVRLQAELWPAETLLETTGHTRPEWTTVADVLENADDYEEWSVIAARAVKQQGV